MKMKKKIAAGFLSIMLSCAMLGGSVLAADTGVALSEPAEIIEESAFAEAEAETIQTAETEPAVKEPGYVGEADVTEVPDADENSETEVADGTEEAIETTDPVEGETAENLTVHRRNVRKTVIITRDGVDEVISDTCISSDELDETGYTSQEEGMILMVGEEIWDLSPADKAYDEYYSQNYGEAALKRKVKVEMKPSGIVGISQKANKGEKNLVEKAKKPGDVQVKWITSWKDGKDTKTEITQFTDTVVTLTLNKTKFTVNDISQRIDLYDYMSWVDQQYPNEYYAEWKSSNTKVATVSGGDDNGVVSFLGSGSAKITGILSTDKGGKITMTATFKVAVPQLSKELIVLKPGKSAKISLKNVDPDANVTWSSSANVTVTGSGPNAVVTNNFGIGGGCAIRGAQIGNNIYYYYVAGLPTKYVQGNVALENGESVSVEYTDDTKTEMEFLMLVNKNRQSNGLKPITNIGSLHAGSSTRAKEMTQYTSDTAYRPNGSKWDTAYSETPNTEFQSYGYGNGSKALNLLMHVGAETYINNGSVTKIGLCAIKTKQKYKVYGTGKSSNQFMVVAFAY